MIDRFEAWKYIVISCLLIGGAMFGLSFLFEDSLLKTLMSVGGVALIFSTLIYITPREIIAHR